jgi:hypothetical protein
MSKPYRAPHYVQNITNAISQSWFAVGAGAMAILALNHVYWACRIRLLALFLHGGEEQLFYTVQGSPMLSEVICATAIFAAIASGAAGGLLAAKLSQRSEALHALLAATLFALIEAALTYRPAHSQFSEGLQILFSPFFGEAFFGMTGALMGCALLKYITKRRQVKTI